MPASRPRMCASSRSTTTRVRRTPRRLIGGRPTSIRAGVSVRGHYRHGWSDQQGDGSDRWIVAADHQGRPQPSPGRCGLPRHFCLRKSDGTGSRGGTRSRDGWADRWRPADQACGFDSLTDTGVDWGHRRGECLQLAQGHGSRDGGSCPGCVGKGRRRFLFPPVESLALFCADGTERIEI